MMKRKAVRMKIRLDEKKAAEDPLIHYLPLVGADSLLPEVNQSILLLSF